MKLLKRFIPIRLLLLFIALLLSLPSPSWSLPLTDGTYDEEFIRHWSRYLPAYDYRWGLAQCYQESLFDPRARSPAGALGLCQFMPATFAECKATLRLASGTHPMVPQISILCNAWYVSNLIRLWKTERPPLEKLKLAQASYNQGAGNTLKAQKLCGMALLWEDIVPCVPQVTGKHAQETITYIKRIRKWYEILISE